MNDNNRRDDLSMNLKKVNKKVIEKVNKEVLIACLVCLAALCMITIFIVTDKTVASASTMKAEKYVKSIQIEAGDTLWGIAKENITKEYNSIEEYIEEIMNSNGLTSDLIHEGQYLIVPYYSVKQ